MVPEKPITRPSSSVIAWLVTSTSQVEPSPRRTLASTALAAPVRITSDCDSITRRPLSPTKSDIWASRLMWKLAGS